MYIASKALCCDATSLGEEKILKTLVHILNTIRTKSIKVGLEVSKKGLMGEDTFYNLPPTQRPQNLKKESDKIACQKGDDLIRNLF